MRLVTLALLVALWTVAGCQGGKPSSSSTGTPAVGAGGTSPAFNLTAVDGSTISFKPLDNPVKDVTLLVFWSFSFDPEVKTLLSRLAELHERYAPRGLRIITITYQEEPSAVRTFLTSNKTPYPVAVGVDSTYEKFQLQAIPTAILVDQAGQIVERWEGHYSTEELSESLAQFLPGRSGNSTP